MKSPIRIYGLRKSLKQVVKVADQNLIYDDLLPATRITHMQRRNKAAKLLKATKPCIGVMMMAVAVEKFVDVHLGQVLTHPRKMERHKKYMKEKYNIIIN